MKSIRRPYYLDLRRIHLPVGGWVSILHRLSGLTLSLAIPVLLYGFMLSLRSPADFQHVREMMATVPGRMLGLLLVWATAHHYLAGLRHLGLDLGLGEGRAQSRKTAWTVLAGGAVGLILWAAWGWHA